MMKLKNQNFSTLIQNIPNYSENTNLFEKNEDNTNLLILDNKISCEYCYNKYSSKISLNLHIKYCQTRLKLHLSNIDIKKLDIDGLIYALKIRGLRYNGQKNMLIKRLSDYENSHDKISIKSFLNL